MDADKVSTSDELVEGARHMERIRIDRRDLSLRARRLAADEAAAAPLCYAAGADPVADEDLLARIDAVLATEPQEHCSPPT